MTLKMTYFPLLVFSVCTGLIDSCQVLEKEHRSANTSVPVFCVGNNAANEVYRIDIGVFGKEVGERLEKNDSIMAGFKIALESAEKSGNSYYKKQIRKLEQENVDLKLRLRNYEANDEPGWEKFKSDFRTELLSLEESYSALGVRKQPRI